MGFLNNTVSKLCCFNCNKPGHITPDCPEPNKRELCENSPAPVAPVQSATQMLIAAAHHDAKSSAGDDLDYDHNFSFHIMNTSTSKNQKNTKSQQVILAQHSILNKHWILLDSQSTISIFASKHLLCDIYTCSDYNTIQCYCNGGYQDMDQEATLPGFGTVYYNPDFIANILSLAQVTKQFRVIYDSTQEDILFLHKKNGDIIKFIKSKMGLYYFDVRSTSKHKSSTTLINSVNENKSLFSKRQLHKAALA